MKWQDKIKRRFKAHLSRTDSAGEIKVTWCSNDDMALGGSLIVDEHELKILVTQETVAVSEDMKRVTEYGYQCDIRYAPNWPGYMLPMDADVIHRVLRVPAIPVASHAYRGNLFIVGARKDFDLDDLEDREPRLYSAALHVAKNGQTILGIVLAIWAEKAVARCRQRSKILAWYDSRWDRNSLLPFSQWTALKHEHSPGQRLFFELFPKQGGDLEAAAAWWAKLCDHDYWHHWDFVWRFVWEILEGRERAAA